MQIKRILSLLVFLILSLSIYSQTRIEGRVLDADSKPVEAATVSVQGKGKGSVTDKKGKYSLEVPANEEVEIVITHISFQAQTYKITLEEGEKRKLDFKMKPTDINIKEVEIQVEKDRDNTMNDLSSSTPL